MSEPKRFKVMFVCIGNSCRSPMAEGFANARHSDVMVAESSGIGPAPEVQQPTMGVMLEKGISVKDAVPRYIRDTNWAEVDLIVNISGTGILEFIPGYNGGNLIWEVEDPMGQPIEVYRKSRDRIEKLVDRLAETLRKHLGVASEPPA